MTATTELDELVSAFESACAVGGPVPLERFLPPAGHPRRANVLCELVRVDLENRHKRGTPKPIAEYRASYPELFAVPELAEAVEFEVARLESSSAAGTEVALSVARTEVLGSTPPPVAFDRTELLGGDPAATACLAAADLAGSLADHRAATIPAVGDEFLGFRLCEELGRGSFGSVYLARQIALADRPVALKITARPNREAQCLARFQHANIVPILSEHRAGDFQAVCMPYFGRTTLGGVLGTLRRQKSLPASGMGLVSTLCNAAATVADADEIHDPAPPADPAPVRAMLSHLSYVDAVVWTIARLADGLAHAHERGVLHRDLKPDNVLIADDGQPMLLDFNLADESSATGAASSLGGTVFYMSPEHLAAFLGDRSQVLDARSDLYALGLIAHEMLTGHHPYPVPKGQKNLLKAMLAERLKPAPGVRSRNAAVPAGVAAVVAKLIAVEPAARYQTARQLADDLDRHLSHRPLLHARESLPARARKWARRNPRAAPLAGLAAALMLAVGAGSLALVFNQRQEKARAFAARDLFRGELRNAAIYLTGSPGDPVRRERAADKLRAALNEYDPAAADWQSKSLVRRLEPAARDGLKRDIGESLFLLARAESHEPAAALALNRRAEAAFGAAVPGAVWRQRAELEARSGDKAAAKAARDRATADETAQDFYLDGADLAADDDHAAAIPLLENACRLAPSHFAANFTLGCCYDALHRNAEALECYRASIALSPTSLAAYVKRGAVYLRRGDVERANHDFDAALAIAPDDRDALFARGVLRLNASQYARAIADFDAAERYGYRGARLKLLRSEARQKSGDETGAARDLAAGLAAKPTSELDHAARGDALLVTDPAAALAEFDAALRLNPRSLLGLQNKANLLEEKLKRPAEAAAVFDAAVALYPDYVPTRIGRAVALAHAGKRAAAHEDVRACLQRDTKPITLYQAACVYALTSRAEPADRREALRLLGAALATGFADFALVDSDADLDAIHGTPEFAKLLREARGH